MCKHTSGYRQTQPSSVCALNLLLPIGLARELVCLADFFFFLNMATFPRQGVRNGGFFLRLCNSKRKRNEDFYIVHMSIPRMLSVSESEILFLVE